MKGKIIPLITALALITVTSCSTQYKVSNPKLGKIRSKSDKWTRMNITMNEVVTFPEVTQLGSTTEETQ